ncbi:MAG: succinate dehydrogenase, hydrophobic membrane anchor protein [Alphaproteobacteria bacterium]|nr:succinate dehydrogenase, hydrophobic membrane anchor protein [Alphaproteobacteria bacterium]
MKLKWEKDGMKSPLGRARGLGAAGHGAEHWIAQRLTAVALIPLAIWFVFSIVHLKGADYVYFTMWLSEPFNAILMILLSLAVVFHAVLGAQVITEDYIHHEGFKWVKLTGQKLFFAALAVACIFSILKVAL